MKVGVLAVQGDYERHVEALQTCALDSEVIEVRTPQELARVDRLIIPGGESTTVGMLLQRYGTGQAICEAAQDGMPIWGTCMGMILMAKEVAGRPNQFTLGLLDIEVRRNAFGAQVHSFEDAVPVENLEEPVTGVFIRAPVVSRVGPGVRPIATYQGQVVAVLQGRRLGTAFHPELTDDRRLHEWFLRL